MARRRILRVSKYLLFTSLKTQFREAFTSYGYFASLQILELIIKQELVESRLVASYMTSIGFPLWLGDRRKFTAKVNEACEAGFDYIELSFDYPWPIPDSSTPRSLVKLIREVGLEVAIHGAWRDVRLASPISEVREASVKYTIKTLEYAREFNPMYVVLHISTDQAVKEVGEYEELIAEAAITSIREILRSAEEYEVNVVFENVPSQYCASIDQMKRIVADIENIKVCFDIGHAQVHAIRAYKNRKIEVKELVDIWFDELGDKIRGVHVYDCLVQGRWIDEHITPSPNSESIKALISAVKSRSLSLDFTVVEAFRDTEGRDASPKSLSEVVSLLKKELL